MRRQTVPLVLVVFLILAGRAGVRGGMSGSVSAGLAPVDSMYRSDRPAMGTTATVWLYAPESRSADALIEAGFAELERVEQALSTYRSTSEVSRVNRRAGKEWTATDTEVFGLLQRSVILSRDTHGAFDVSVGRLVRALGFRGGESYAPGSPEAEEALAMTGYHLIELRPEDRSIRFAVDGVELDFGASGKGYGLDRMATVLRAGGATAALVGIGQSSYFAIGAPQGHSEWSIDVVDPMDSTFVIGKVGLFNGSVSTSGGGRRFIQDGDRQYGHILDPRSGESVKDVWQVTVKAPTAEESDALATACFVLGFSDCRQVLTERGEDFEMLWLGPEDGIPVVRSVNWTSELSSSVAAVYVLR